MCASLDLNRQVNDSIQLGADIWKEAKDRGVAGGEAAETDGFKERWRDCRSLLTTSIAWSQASLYPHSFNKLLRCKNLEARKQGPLESPPSLTVARVVSKVESSAATHSISS